MEALQLTIVSPEQQLFAGEVRQVTLPGAQGAFMVLPQHAPIVSILVGGKLTYVTLDGHEEVIEVQGGFMEMSFNKVSVCVE